MMLPLITIVLVSLLFPVLHATPTAGGCKLSAAQKDWIKTNEGFCPGPKLCSGALGYGHDCAANKDCPKIATPMTKASASSLFEKDWPKYAAFIKANLPNTDGLNSNQFAALVDYSFNTGAGNPKYLKQYFEGYMEKREYDNVCRDMQLAFTYPDIYKKNADGSWSVRPGGPPKGKVNRRRHESEYCSMPTSVMSGC